MIWFGQRNICSISQRRPCCQSALTGKARDEQAAKQKGQRAQECCFVLRTGLLGWEGGGEEGGRDHPLSHTRRIWLRAHVSSLIWQAAAMCLSCFCMQFIEMESSSHTSPYYWRWHTQHRRRMGVYVLWTVVLCSWLIVGPSSEFYYILVKLCKVVKHFREIFFFLQLLLHVSMFRGL